jgi:hypothetical protein
MLIPAMPLISIYLPEHSRFWPTSDAFVISHEDHTAVYVLLIASGLLFTLGSLLLVRCFLEPEPEPLFSCYLFVNDEVLASWIFFVATVITVPICVVYYHYFPYSLYYYGAIIVCAAASLVMLLFTYAVYPLSDGGKPKSLVAPLLHRCCCGPTSKIYKHVENDWLLICWLFVYGSILGVVGCVGALIYFAYHHNRRGIFDYATG